MEVKKEEIRKEPEKHVHKSLTTGKEVKKTGFQKALGLFLAEDASMVSDSLMDDFIRPRLKKFSGEMVLKGKEFIADSLITLIQMVIFGKNNTKTSNGSGYTTTTGRVNYTSYYNGKPVVVTGYADQPDRDEVGVRLYTVPTIGKAEEVLTELSGIIGRYKHATLADYYQLLDAPTVKTDWSYGWFDLDEAKVVRYDGEYMIQFPKPIPLG